MLVGIGDDAAVVEPEKNRVEVLTVDAIVEGVHFDRAFVPPDAIGHRALAVNLSDLAAMGATPRLALLSLMLQDTLPLADFDGIISGLTALAAQHRIHVAGGNLTRSPGPLTIDVTVAGTVKRRQALTRSGARPGDEIYVSGTIGAAAAGLTLLRRGAAAHPNADCRLIQAYTRPDPRVRLGVWLGRNRAASACVDLSDGLADGVRRIAEASGVGITIDAEALPIEPAARDVLGGDGGDPMLNAISGGDDYELLCAVRPRKRRAVLSASRHAGIPLTRIGVCTDERTVRLRTAGQDVPMPCGYTHFRRP
jgi:thiamine-monophosphate kinase